MQWFPIIHSKEVKSDTTKGAAKTTDARQQQQQQQQQHKNKLHPQQKQTAPESKTLSSSVSHISKVRGNEIG